MYSSYTHIDLFICEEILGKLQIKILKEKVMKKINQNVVLFHTH